MDEKFHAVHQTVMEMLLEFTGKYALYRSFRLVSVILDSIFRFKPKRKKKKDTVKTNFWVLAQQMYGLKPKTTQHNKFAENGLGNWASENQVTEEQILVQKWER